MGILDKIIGKEDKKNQKIEKIKEKNEKEEKGGGKIKKEELKTAVKDKKTEIKTASKKKIRKIDLENAPIHYFEIIDKPHISEKALKFMKEGKYVFQISRSANKSEIKKAIENLYGVSVESVNLIKVPRKPKRFRGVPGFKSGYRKAIVTLNKGEIIDIMKEA